MGKKDAPPAPDYIGAAAAEGEANKESAFQTAVLSNPNINTPYGSQTVTWGYPGQSSSGFSIPQNNSPFVGAQQGFNQSPTQDPSRNSGPTHGRYGTFNIGNEGGNNNGGGYGGLFQPNYGTPSAVAGIPQATINQTFSPTEQEKYDKNAQLDISLLDTANTGLGRVNAMMDTPFDMSGLTDVSQVSGINAASYLQQNPDVAAWAQQTAAATGQSAEELAAQHYQQYGMYEGRRGAGNSNFDTSGLRDFQGIDLNGLPEGGSLQAGGEYQTGINLGELSPNGQLSNNGLRDFQQLNTDGLQGFSGIDLNQLAANGQLDQNTLSQLQGVNVVDPSQLDPYSVQASVGGLQQVTDAIRSRGDEDFQRRRRDMETDLITRGFTPSSEGFKERMDILDQQQNDFNQQAILAGGQEQSRIAGLENQRRSMGLNEQQSQYASQMGLRGQQFGEQQQIADFAQRLRAQGLNEQQVKAQVDSAIRGQQFGERSTMADDAARQRGQQFQEQEAMAQFAQQLRAQGLTEQQVAAEMENARRSQRFGEQSQVANFQESQRANRLGEQQTQAGVNNAIRGQQFGERGALASFDQSEQQRQLQNQIAVQQSQAQERQRQIQEQAYLRQLPLNEINALRTGSQATLPQFQAYQGANVSAAPIFDAAAAQGNYDMAAYQAQPDVLGGLFQLGGAALSGGMFGAGGMFGKPG